MGVVVFAIGLFTLPIALIALGVTYAMRRSRATRELPPAQTAWVAAEKQYTSRSSGADAELKRLAASQNQAVKKAEANLAAWRSEGTKKLDSLGSAVTLFQDRVQTAQGTLVFANGPVQAVVETSGALVKTGEKILDTRNCFLTLSGANLTAVVQCRPDQEAAVRSVAAAIINTSVAWPSLKASADLGVAQAAAALEATIAARDAAIASATESNSAVKSDTADLDAARSAAGVQFCATCDRNVVVSNGACVKGHTAALSDARYDKKLASPVHLRLGKVELSAIAVSVLALLMMCGGVAATPPSTGATASKPATSKPAASKPLPVTPTITFVAPDSSSTEASATVALKITPADAKVEGSVDGTTWTPILKGSDGSWKTVWSLVPGPNTYLVKATSQGLETTASTSVTFTPPIVLKVNDPPATVEQGSVVVAGSATPGSAVTVNGVPANMAPDGSFSAAVPLAMGSNTLPVKATKALYGDASDSVSVTRIESQAEYMASCGIVAYKVLAKNPDAYLGQRMRFKGKIFNISETASGGQLQMWVTKGSYSIWSDAVVVTYKGTIPYGQDDVVVVFGEGLGAMTGTNAFGGDISQPGIAAKYVAQ